MKSVRIMAVAMAAVFIALTSAVPAEGAGKPDEKNKS